MLKFKKDIVAKIKKECFKPYKGNVKIFGEYLQKEDYTSFKPYKGNVKIYLTTHS